MAGDADLGVLERLASLRQLDIDALAQLADVAELELRTVFNSGAPNPSLLRGLTPVLGLHTADLFAMVGAEVPDALAPADTTAGSLVPHLVRRTVALAQEESTEPVPRLPVYEQYSPGPPGTSTPPTTSSCWRSRPPGLSRPSTTWRPRSGRTLGCGRPVEISVPRHGYEQGTPITRGHRTVHLSRRRPPPGSSSANSSLGVTTAGAGALRQRQPRYSYVLAFSRYGDTAP